MANWAEFSSGDAVLAGLAKERIDLDGLVAVGTIRRNGWPRISPVEPLIFADELYLGMMSDSRKATDLQRDPRCVVHSTVHDKSGVAGDVKIYGRAVEVSDAEERERYCEALHERIGWHPAGDFHLFAVDITEVGYFAVGEEGHETRTWVAPEPDELLDV
jgi:nitroimidazol reductase NimA-like FMN-containing flavoprotein (pyridoxamine 5'-phosphate oxidase superfamily)